MSTGFLPSYPGAMNTGSSPAIVVEVGGDVVVVEEEVVEVDRDILGDVVVAYFGTPDSLVVGCVAGGITRGVERVVNRTPNTSTKARAAIKANHAQAGRRYRSSFKLRPE